MKSFQTTKLALEGSGVFGVVWDVPESVFELYIKINFSNFDIMISDFSSDLMRFIGISQ